MSDARAERLSHAHSLCPCCSLPSTPQVAPADLRAADAIRAACARRGMIGLWRGYFAGLCVWGPFSAVYFASYEAIRDAMGREAVGSNLMAGMGGGAIAAVTTQPLDCARTRLQVGLTKESAGLMQVVRDIFAREGLQALMRGTLARALWLAPGCGITITVFDNVAALLQTAN
uniref:Mitochondrial carrier protein n=1 Tax=Calcidiscus leptoporus TaxID=127549 RepID=A0A7S0IPK9_9EUKA|mmetsp:Transcript_16044/g.36689  ORF Transcript_16044/g.36689 Transcript_16044/m.36689 type:complete len:173 (+) Transcript_16044:728-1246(+)